MDWVGFGIGKLIVCGMIVDVFYFEMVDVVWWYVFDCMSEVKYYVNGLLFRVKGIFLESK